MYEESKLKFVGTYCTENLHKKFRKLCRIKDVSNSKMLLALIMAATKNIVLDEKSDNDVSVNFKESNPSST